MKKVLNSIFDRTFMTVLLMILQIVVLIFIILQLCNYFYLFYILFIIISIVIAISILSNDDTPDFKYPWVIIISVFPIFGGIFYLIYGRYRNKKKKYVVKKTKYLVQNENILKKLKKDLDVYSQVNYLSSKNNMPIYTNTKVSYFPTGEKAYKRMLLELKNAKKFIFIEYFIIKKGIMWNSILDILKEKAKDKVDIRIIYDDIGCSKSLPTNYFKELEKYGIKCISFNKFSAIYNLNYNNRDHRKIMNIDNRVCFTGGINLADEYINEISRLGYWKDNCIMLEGEAVKSFTYIFLKTWNFEKNFDKSFNKFFIENKMNKYKDFVQPYWSNPFNKELVAYTVYMNLINSANKYVYIMTPYLSVGYDMINALCMAAKRGVDVRIITPYIYDKKVVEKITKSNYNLLITAGVKIYEFRPGFIHSKTIISDDRIGVVGTINFDYRSLRHNYECAVLIASPKTIKVIKKDFINTFNESYRIEKSRKEKNKWIMGILRFIGPLV